MRYGPIGALCCVGALTACFEQSPKLSKEQIELLEAMLFAVTGLENNTKEGDGPPLIRNVGDRYVELRRISKNRIGTSDAETNAIIRKSDFIRFVKRISSPEPCVFRLEERTEFSKGDSQEDFSSYVMRDDSDALALYLSNAYRFAVVIEYREPKVVLQGPSVMCRWGSCENIWESNYRHYWHRGQEDKKEQIERTERAIALIKKTCPGKPY